MIKRHKPLKRTPLKRSVTPLRPRSKGNRRARERRHQDTEYLAWLKEQHCAVCGSWPSDAAHVGPRGLGQKCPNWQSIPLCHSGHHQEGSRSHHVLGKAFWDAHDIDRDSLINHYNTLWINEGNTFKGKDESQISHDPRPDCRGSQK